MIGDFNELTTQDEKIGGRPRPRPQMEAFKSALDANGLLDLGWVNQKFTWSNKHGDGTYTMECLDRAAANQTWVSDFGNAGVETLATTGPDHYALLLATQEIGYSVHCKKIFRFKVKWALDKDGEQPLHTAWQE